jgi:gas vesicle protein
MMNKVVNIAAGLILGAAVGAGVVLLLAPRSGEETRQAVRDQIDAILAEGQQAAETRRLELSERFATLKEPGYEAPPIPDLG